MGRESQKPIRTAACFALVELESRLLYCVDGLSPGHSSLEDASGHLPSTYIPNHPDFVGPVVSSGGAVLAGSPLSSLPALNSRPSANAQLYLDFDGISAFNWGGYNVTTTPALDQDGDALTFSSGELDNIQQIWARVAEAYSPFDINVTTVDPGNLTDGQTLKVVIGGSGSWLGASAGGVSFVGSFVNGSPNVAFAFPAMLGN